MQEFQPQNLRYTRLVDRYARYISSPVLRLKFLSSALNVDQSPRLWRKLPLVGMLPDRAMIIMELSKVLPPDEAAPLGIRLTSLLWRVRYVLYAMCVVVVLLAGTSLVYAITRIASSLSTSTEAKDISANNLRAGAATGGDAVAAIASGAAPSLDKVWLAEQGPGYEFYSNGARVLTEFETAGAKRSFYRFDLEELPSNSGQGGEILNSAVGIVYHVSESDLLPFADRYNSSLQNHSRSLLEYARENKLYNYLIDRFGRTYRIVRDEFAANHAGNSIWSDGRSLYVNLSPSFIGICFEGRGAEIGAEGINEAQIYAARILTAVLRSKYGIEDANCVTHGLVSVNPSNRLMGYHTDWVSEFPFEALGLSDKYETELMAISRLGFGYDQAYVAAAGGRWPGLEKADAALRETAQKGGSSLDEQRRSMSRVFSRIYSKQRTLEK